MKLLPFDQCMQQLCVDQNMWARLKATNKVWQSIQGCQGSIQAAIEGVRETPEANHGLWENSEQETIRKEL